MTDTDPLCVDIEYCSSCGFFAKAVEVQETLVAAFGDRVEVAMEAGRPTSFEVTAGDVVLHSKLETKSWPKHADLVTRVGEMLGSGEEAAAAAAAIDAEEEANARAAALTTPAKAREIVEEFVRANRIAVFSRTFCPFCKKAKAVFDGLGEKYAVMELDERPDGDAIQAVVAERTGHKTVPAVFCKQQYIGGGDDTVAKAESGELQQLLASKHGAVEMAELGVAIDVAPEKQVEFPQAGVESHYLSLPLQMPMFWFPYNLNKVLARVIAVQVAFLSLLAVIFLHEEWTRLLVACIFADFVLRVLLGGRGSLLGATGALIAYYLPHKVTPGAPKQFAQMIGMLMTGAATLVLYIDRGDDTNEIVMAVLMAVMVVFAALEGFADYCAGCTIFKFLINTGIVAKDPSRRSDQIAAELHYTIGYIKERLEEEAPEVIKYNAPGQIPLKYKSKSDEYRREDFHLIKHAHITTFGSAMGMVGVAAMWKVAADLSLDMPRAVWVTATVAAAVWFCALFTLYVLRFILYPSKALKELNCNVRSNFAAAIAICPVAFAWILASEDRDAAKVLFWVGAVPALLISLLVMTRWVTRTMNVDTYAPVWMIAPVGNLVAGAVAPVVSSDYYDVAFLFYGSGLLMWLFMFFTTLQKVMFGYLVEKFKGTLMIWVAAPAAAFFGYVILNPSPTLDFTARTLFGITLFIWLWLSTLALKAFYARPRWNMSYWAYSFPQAAFAMACIYYHNAVGTSLTHFMAVGSLSVATGVTLLQIAHTISAVGSRHAFKAEMKFGPPAFFKVLHYAGRFAIDEKLTRLVRRLKSPKRAAEFLEAWNGFKLLARTQADFEEQVCFPEMEALFPGVTQPARDLSRQVLEHVDRIEELVDAVWEDGDNQRAVPAAAAKELGEQVKALGVVTHQLYNFQERDLAPVCRKHMTLAWLKDTVRRVFLHVPAATWRVLLPWAVTNQRLHMRRVKMLKALHWCIPERMQLVGHWLYQGVDELLWHRLVVDVGVMVPRRVSGWARM